MTEQPIKEDPVERFRKLIRSLSPLTRLPKRGPNSPAFLQQAAEKNDETPKPKTSPVKKDAPAAPAPQKPDPIPVSDSQSRYSPWGPRLWTTASVISLTINILLTIILIILVISVYRLKLDVNNLMKVGQDLVDLPGGLYENFEKMDRANIATNVQVNTMIPVQFDLALNQQTTVVLSEDVVINNALVTVNTGGLNITRANTTIVLPQGTSLPILLNLTVPVNTEVPVTLNVPVDIPLSATELNEPFVGLQEVIKPLYCFLDPQAVNLDGQPICP